MSFPPTSPSADSGPWHRFIVVMPVADRPQHIRACLDSLLELQQRHPYGQSVEVLIADDSADDACVADNRALASHYSRLGIPTEHFGPAEQLALLDSLGEAGMALARVIGNAPRENFGNFGHKGQGAMRNIAYLRLAQRLGDDRETLVWSIDSDQEFKVKVAADSGDTEVFDVPFFHALDAIFSRTNALLVTGKVVGDPPVSPAVMTGNFLDDVLGFLRQTADGDPAAPCTHHAAASRRQGEAAYHDMADMFGFGRAAAYDYRCPLTGSHSEADCFAHFAARLPGFFHGEHPTRVSYYEAGDALASVQPARTVYAGNYVFRAAGLRYFLPFSHLRLRMSGPTLGRLVKSQEGPRFVSANLPMLHRRTVEGTAQAEFRPGIATAEQIVDMGGEFERQFYGDVMLFAIERLTAAGFPRGSADEEGIAATIDAMRAEMLERYNARHEAIRAKLKALEDMLGDAGRWWRRQPHHAQALAHFAGFVASVAHNFGEDATACRRINDTGAWAKWRTELIDAVVRYPADCAAWEAALDAARRAR